MGSAKVVRFMRHGAGFPARDFLDAHEELEPAFLAMATQYAETGRIVLRERGHWLSGPFRQIFEFKPRRGRIFAFEHESMLYLTNGAMKTAKAKAQESDYQRALVLRQDFYDKLSRKTDNRGNR